MQEKKLKKKLTSRKTKEDAKIEKVVEKDTVTVQQFLSREDQQALENATNATEKARLSMVIQEQVLVNKKLESAMAVRAVDDAQKLLTAKSYEYETRAKNAGDIIKSLAAKHAVVGNFQYDPISGRIIREHK